MDQFAVIDKESIHLRLSAIFNQLGGECLSIGVGIEQTRNRVQYCRFPRDCLPDGLWVNPGVTKSPDDLVDGATFWEISECFVPDRDVVSSQIAALSASRSLDDLFIANFDLVALRLG